MSDRLEAPGTWSNAEVQLIAGIADPWYRSISEVTAACLDATNVYHRGLGHLPVLMPITTGAISSPIGRGSDSLPVCVELFGERVFLADSMQFQLEYLIRQGFPGVFYVMPTFRGEDPDPTHLNQFFHAEAEIEGDLDAVIDHVSAYVRCLTMTVANSPVIEIIERAAAATDHLRLFTEGGSIPRITFEEATHRLGAGNEVVATRRGQPLALRRAGERQLIDMYGGAVWVTHPPAEAVPFYQAVDSEGRALAADLLFGVGEVVGCGQRQSTGDLVRASLEVHNVDPDPYRWYCTMKDHFPLQTAGFGLGLERYLLWLLCHDDVRDLHALPRLRGVPHFA